MELLALAQEHDVSVIEDTVMENLAFGMKPPPRLAELVGGEHSLYTVGSLSKTLWGGLRVGWVRASASAVLRLGRLKAALDLGTSAPAQALALSLLPIARRDDRRPAGRTAGADGGRSPRSCRGSCPSGSGPSRRAGTRCG